MSELEYSLTIWDWEPAWRDLKLFKAVVSQAADLGFNKIELGVPWDEPTAGRPSLENLESRVDYVERSGLALRLRLNLQDPPSWYEGDFARLESGVDFNKGYGSEPHLLPSTFDVRALSAQASRTAQVCDRYAGRGYEYSLGIGLHYELKYGAWTGHERSGVTAYRSHLKSEFGQIASLNNLWGTDFQDFDQVCVPSDRQLASELKPASVSWISFREASLRVQVSGLTAVIGERDPSATISAPLGEGFRSEAAEFGNQDIFGLSRGANNVVFSYDFYLHDPTDVSEMGRVVGIYGSITGLPIKLELDGMAMYKKYGDALVYEYGVSAARSGCAGVNVANFNEKREYSEALTTFPFLGQLGSYLDTATPADRSRGETVDVLLPKWSFYGDRSGGRELAHQRAREVLEGLDSTGVIYRVISDEQLNGVSGRAIAVPGGAAMTATSLAELNDLTRSASLIRSVDESVLLVDQSIGGQLISARTQSRPVGGGIASELNPTSGVDLKEEVDTRNT